jgi:hypothetical protein
MTNEERKDIVQQLLGLIDQQTKLLQKQKPMTEEEACAYRERFIQIKKLVENLNGDSVVQNLHS